jgi:hypothetical protein
MLRGNRQLQRHLRRPRLPRRLPAPGPDPIVTAAEAVLNLQQFVSRELDPTEPAVVTVGQVQRRHRDNIIPDHGDDRGHRPHAQAFAAREA